MPFAETYIADMKNRGQTEDRIEEVTQALNALDSSLGEQKTESKDDEKVMASRKHSGVQLGVYLVRTNKGHTSATIR